MCGTRERRQVTTDHRIGSVRTPISPSARASTLGGHSSSATQRSGSGIAKAVWMYRFEYYLCSPGRESSELAASLYSAPPTTPTASTSSTRILLAISASSDTSLER